MAQGVQDLIELLNLVCDGVNVAVAVAQPGHKLGLEDAKLLFNLIPDLGPALSGVANVPAEISDLDESEAAQVVSAVMAKLAIGDAHARDVVQKSLLLLSAGAALVQSLKSPPAPAAA